MEPYVINALSKSSQDFVFSFVGSNRGRSEAFSFAVAAAIVNDLPLNPGDDLSTFTLKIRPNLPFKMGTLNEMLRLDIDRVIDFATRLYQYRVAQMNGGQFITPIISQATAACDFFGITKYFTPLDLTMLGENGNQIVVDIMKLKHLFMNIGFCAHEQ